jgi:hypothetical protein
MSKWFKEGGFLNEEGKRVLIDFRSALDNILSKDEVREMTFSEVQTLGSNLHKMVGDAITDRISARMQFAKALEEMTDEQFEAYLKAKHGSVWNLITLLPEELARVRPLTDKQIEDAIEKGRQDADAVRKATPSLNPSGLYYKKG